LVSHSVIFLFFFILSEHTVQTYFILKFFSYSLPNLDSHSFKHFLISWKLKTLLPFAFNFYIFLLTFNFLHYFSFLLILEMEFPKSLKSKTSFYVCDFYITHFLLFLYFISSLDFLRRRIYDWKIDGNKSKL